MDAHVVNLPSQSSVDQITIPNVSTQCTPILLSTKVNEHPDLELLAWVVEGWGDYSIAEKPISLTHAASDVLQSTEPDAVQEIKEALSRLTTPASFSYASLDEEARPCWFDAGGSILHVSFPIDVKTGLSVDQAIIGLHVGLRDLASASGGIGFNWHVLRNFPKEAHNSRRLWRLLQSAMWKPLGSFECTIVLVDDVLLGAMNFTNDELEEDPELLVEALNEMCDFDRRFEKDLTTAEHFAPQGVRYVKAVRRST